MSGRVRWRRLRWTAGDVVLVRGDDWIGDIGRDEGGVWRAVCLGYARAERTFARRSDAKRWLLARAAGLAGVPRWQRVKRGGVEDGDARRPPTGWRRLTTVEIGGDPVSVYERNRRRR